MKKSTINIINNLCNRYPILLENKNTLTTTVETFINCFENGGKLLVCGNGGSAADSLHIVGELMKSFVLPRPLSEDMKSKINSTGEYGEYLNSKLQGAFPAIALVGSSALETAIGNDMASEFSFAQQVLGLGTKGDILLCISTSGNSRNVIYAIEVARAKGLVVIGVTGKTGGKMKEKCDYLLNVQESETYKIQELHLPIYHCICLALENEFYGE